MRLVIRAPRLQPEEKPGVPRDFAQVRDYFNLGIERGAYYWIPRRIKITDAEITRLWVLSMKTNLSLVAELHGKVVGSATVFYDPNSTGYEHARKRSPGEMAMTVDFREDFEVIAKRLVLGLNGELTAQKRTAVARMAAESPGRVVMRELSYVGRGSGPREEYADIGLSGRVYEFKLPRRLRKSFP